MYATGAIRDRDILRQEGSRSSYVDVGSGYIDIHIKLASLAFTYLHLVMPMSTKYYYTAAQHVWRVSHPDPQDEWCIVSA